MIIEDKKFVAVSYDLFIKDEEGKNLLAALFAVVADPLSDEDYEAMELQVLEAFEDYADPEPEETVPEMPWDYGKHFED